MRKCFEGTTSNAHINTLTHWVMMMEMVMAINLYALQKFVFQFTEQREKGQKMNCRRDVEQINLKFAACDKQKQKFTMDVDSVHDYDDEVTDKSSSMAHPHDVC